MDDNVLEEVLALEQQLRAERTAVETRLAAEFAALQQQLAQQVTATEEQLAAEREAFLAQVRRAASAEAEALLDEARRDAGRLDALDDARLCALLRRHLPRLLPGRGDDRPHGQD